MIYGENDTLSDFDYQKELMYSIDSLESVKFLPGYGHQGFMGREDDNSLQEMLLAVMNGDSESGERWT